MLNTIYGDNLPEMEKTREEVISVIEDERERLRKKYDADPVEHLLSRIKSEESMREKCRRKGIPETSYSALHVIRDAIGVRAVCDFLNDVYELRNALVKRFETVEEKDYIKNVKPNGYRSLHLILKDNDFYVEVQLRTISMDTWAALEHNIRYKRDISGNTELIAKELKRCADELASTDVQMQTLRDLINGEL